ncbi:MAG TPA: hypothetical protein VNE38_13685 [Ktedonobacteraceae bacterium]|nr:hypothetical protein [Ktedonobacteraceae bacterium]
MENEELDYNGTTDAETGSDELLSDDNLRLPESANVLVRLHAVNAWLARRHDDMAIEVGTAALEMQQAMSGAQDELRPRRRAHQQAETTSRVARAQQQLADAQQRLGAIEEARALLEDCTAHTNGERVLVEYYLAVEQLLLDNGYSLSDDTPTRHTPWFDTMVEVLQRVEHVGTPQED